MIDLINYMEKKINDEDKITYSEPKMVIQGGHDTTLNVILHFMNAAFNIPTEYITFGSHIYFELHKEVKEEKIEYIVKYFFNGKLLLEKDFESFRKKVLETVWSDEKIHNFCFKEEEDKNKGNNENLYKDDKSTTITVLIITNIIAIILAIIFAILMCRFKKKSDTIALSGVDNGKLVGENNI